jgi:hypothetical protein
MSRVLRRPMFRGGIADSEGVGITSGLTDNYSQGGRVGFANGPSYFDVISPYSKQFGTSIIDPGKMYEKKISEIEKETADTGYMYDPSGLTPIVQGRTKTIAELDLLTEKGKSDYIKNLQKQREDQIKKISETSKNLSDEQKNQLFSYYGINQKDLSNIQKSEEKISGTGVETGARAGGTEQPAKSDLKTVYEDLLPLFSKELGASEDEFSRQKYLELAKFGLNLLRQPGGLPGGKSDLLGAIAASAEKPLEGYQAIISKEQQAKRLPKALALEAAMKLSDPSDISKKIKSLAQISGLSEQQVAKSFITTGESSLKSITSTAESLAEDVGKLPALKIATTMQEAGISISQVKKLPKDTKGNIVGDKINEGFYYDNDGTLYKFGKDKKLQPVITK